MTSAERAAAKAAANAKKRKRWRDDRAYLRINDPKFVEKEQASHHKYTEFTRLARQFARHFPEQFEHFKRAIVKQGSLGSLNGRPAAPLPLAAPRMLPTVPAIVPSTNESGRPKPAVDLIALLGLARD
jgi:hypothetical protein